MSPLPPRESACVLLFSGGRDSTLAALRAAQQFKEVILLTATSPHLVGIERVKSRLRELATHMSGDTLWLQISMSVDTPIRSIPGMDNCLPCRQTYFAAAVKTANEYRIGKIAAGYAAYQSNWLEQSPYAISSLKRVLESVGKELVLPVADVASKEDAMALLRSHNISDTALEQKCMRQSSSAEHISEEQIRNEVDQWSIDLRNLLHSPQSVPIEVLAQQRLGDFGDK
jgi:PP-loop superfamily ATP-utilizing enzyme